MKDWTIEDYLEELASASPAPGGGAAAALTAAQGAALLSMVLAISYKEDLPPSHLDTEFRNARLGFLKLAMEDGEAFKRVTKAYQLPKESEEQKDKRQWTVQKRLREAAAVPMSVMDRVVAVLEEAKAVAQEGRSSVISDAAIGAVLLESALVSAEYTVRINLKYIKDEAFCHEMKTRCDHLLHRGRTLKDKLLGDIDSIL